MFDVMFMSLSIVLVTLAMYLNKLEMGDEY